MSEKVILDIQIPSDEISAAEKAITQMRGKVEQLREANKGLSKSSDAYTKNAIEVKKLSGEIRQNERILIANSKAQKANEGSVTQLREQLKQASRQWADLSKEERENTAAGQKLAKQKLELTDRLKALEKQTGDNRRNVGNYSEGMHEALQQSGLLSQAQEKLAVAMRTYNVVVGTGTKTTRIFTAALAATGIGAIIVLLGTLYGALRNTEKGTSKLNGIINRFKGILNGLFQVLEPLAMFIIDQVIDAFDQLGVLASKALGLIESGLRALGFDSAAKGVGNFAEQQRKASEAARQLAEEERKLGEELRRQSRVQLEYQKRAEELRQIRDDESASMQERVAANRELGKLLTEQSKEELAIAQHQLEVANLRIKAEGESTANLDTQAEALDKIAEIEERITSQRSEQLVNLNSLRKEQKEAVDERKQQVQEQLELEREANLIELEQEIEATRRKIELVNKEEILGLKRQLINKQITREQYNAEILNMELTNLQAQLEVRRAMGLNTVELETMIADKIIEQQQRITGAKEGAAKAQMETEEMTAEQKKGLVNQGLSAFKNAAGEETAAAKAVGVVQATISTFTAAAKALEAGPILGPILAGLITAQGLAQVAKINSTETPGFAEGVIGLQGPGSETSDSIPARLSKGESVITAKATSAYAPQLAAMEASVGNNPNYQLGNLRFADGIINAGMTPAIDGARADAASRQNQTSINLKDKIWLSLTELDRDQTELNDAKTFARISE